MIAILLLLTTCGLFHQIFAEIQFSMNFTAIRDFHPTPHEHQLYLIRNISNVKTETILAKKMKNENEFKLWHENPVVWQVNSTREEDYIVILVLKSEQLSGLMKEIMSKEYHMPFAGKKSRDLHSLWNHREGQFLLSGKSEAKCTEHWHGKTCDFYCDDSSGNVTCNLNRRRVECIEGKMCKILNCNNLDCTPGSRCVGNSTQAFCECPKGKKSFCQKQTIEQKQLNKSKVIDNNNNNISLAKNSSASSTLVKHLCNNDSECHNGGKCIVGKTGGHYCECSQGYSPPHCKMSTIVCGHYYCENNGECIRDIVTSTTTTTTNNNNNDDKMMAWCKCKKGFVGKSCEYRQQPCKPFTKNPCQNDGICTELIFNQSEGEPLRFIHCNCPKGYKGLVCDIYSTCNYDSCLNGGMCVNGTSPKCICPPGFYGENCQYKSLLNEIGTTTETTTITSESTQLTITTSTQPQPSSSSSSLLCHQCISQNTIQCQTSCECKEGFFGRWCELANQMCEKEQPCKNNGKCLPSQVPPYFKCTCLPEFEGTNCEFSSKHCSFFGNTNPCFNGGTCFNRSPSSKTDFVCACPPHFSGKRCENQITKNPCNKRQCENGGFCYAIQSTLDGEGIEGIHFRCQCVRGYGGPLCQYRNPCVADTLQGNDLSTTYQCFHGGKCIFQSHKNQTICECPFGYGGNHCEEEIPCLKSYVGAVCGHERRGKCAAKTNEDDDKQQLYCQCPTGWSGSTCDRDIDECSLHNGLLCLNNGECINQLGNYTCRCQKGFHGNRCELKEVRVEKMPQVSETNGFVVYVLPWILVVLLFLFIQILFCSLHFYRRLNNIPRNSMTSNNNTELESNASTFVIPQESEKLMK